MATRLKDLFTGDRKVRSRSLSGRRDSDAFRSTTYEATSPGQQPRIGTYPLRGNTRSSYDAKQTHPTHRGRRSTSSAQYARPTTRDRPSSMDPPGRRRVSEPTQRPGQVPAPGTALTTDDRNYIQGTPIADQFAKSQWGGDGSSRTVHPKASHVDIYEAAQPTSTYQEGQYGEDVANRNIADEYATRAAPGYSYLSAVYGEDVADRNITEHRRHASSSTAKSSPQVNYGEDVADRNMSPVSSPRGAIHHRTFSPHSHAQIYQPPDVTQNTTTGSPNGGSPTARRGVAFDIYGPGHMRRMSRDKPLPPPPEVAPPEVPRRSLGRTQFSPSGSPRLNQDLPSIPRNGAATAPGQSRSVSTTPPGAAVSSSQPAGRYGTEMSGGRGEMYPKADNIEANQGSQIRRRPVDGSVDIEALKSRKGDGSLTEDDKARKLKEMGVDVSNSEDTEVVTRQAPAVTHETVNQHTHHIREERITREIHNHYHRILPVIDVQVLPPRHFIPVAGGGLVEIPADQVPGRTGPNHTDWTVVDTNSRIPSNTDAASIRPPVDFTSARIDTTPKEYVTKDGIRRTETTHIHPPVLETGARDTGQSWPMVFDVPPAQVPKRKSSLRGTGGQTNAAVSGAAGRTAAGSTPKQPSAGDVPPGIAHPNALTAAYPQSGNAGLAHMAPTSGDVDAANEQLQRMHLSEREGANAIDSQAQDSAGGRSAESTSAETNLPMRNSNTYAREGQRDPTTA